MPSSIRIGLLLLVVVVVVATGGPDTALLDTSNSTVQSAADNASDESLTRTIVILGSDGHQQWSVETITRAELERQRARRGYVYSNRGIFALVSQAYAQSNEFASDLFRASCDDPRSLWLFDEPNLSGNMICLIRDAGANIGFDALSWIRRRFTRRTGYLHWGGAVRSFWAGSDPGYFRLHFSPFTVERFEADQRADSVSQTVADAYVLALTRPGATTEVTFTGWRFGLVRCSAINVDPGSSFTISDGQEGYIETQIPGTGTHRSDGLLDCSYSKIWPLRYGVTYNVAMAGGSCRLMVLEDFIIKPSGLQELDRWHIGRIHFYDNTCWPWAP